MAQRIEVATLQCLVEAVATKVRSELGIVAECVYLGQVTGSESNRSYIREPQEWIVEGGAWAPQQTLASEWRWGGGTEVVEHIYNNAQKR